MTSSINGILSPKARRERNRQEMLETLLDLAEVLMQQEGVSALNLNEVAKQVGMKTPSLYNYFASKMALYEALFERGMGQFHARLDVLEAQHPTPSWQGYEAAMLTLMLFAKERPAMYQLLFERPVPGFTPSPAGLLLSQRLLDRSTALIEQSIAAGLIDSAIDPLQARDLFIALTQGMVTLHIANEPDLPIGEGRFGGLIPAAIAILQAAWAGGR